MPFGPNDRSGFGTEPSGGGGFNWGQLIPAAVSAAGSLIGGAQANSTNVALSREQMAFQERMSSTSYQRAMSDMRMAGLNPALAYMQGGASSPSGNAATVNDVISPAVSSAKGALQLTSELKSQKVGRDLARAQEYKSRAEGDMADAVGQKAQAERVVINNFGRQQAEANLRRTNMETAGLAAELGFKKAKGTGGDVVNRGLTFLKDLPSMLYPRRPF